MNASRLKNLLPGLRNAGPYLLIELLLPGGTLLALLLWLSQGMSRNTLAGVLPPIVPASAVERVVVLPESFQVCGSCAK